MSSVLFYKPLSFYLKCSISHNMRYNLQYRLIINNIFFFKQYTTEHLFRTDISCSEVYSFMNLHCQASREDTTEVRCLRLAGYHTHTNTHTHLGQMCTPTSGFGWVGGNQRTKKRTCETVICKDSTQSSGSNP